MEATNNTSFIRTKKFLSCILLALIYSWTPILTLAQMKKAEANTAIQVVSDEAYQYIIQFYAYDSNLPLDVKNISKEDYQGGSKEKIVFSGVNYSRVPAYLISPKNGGGPHPVVLIIDGGLGSKERWVQDDNWPKGGLITKALLAKGFAVMICDAAYHGERSYENEFASFPWPNQYPYSFRQIAIQTAFDYRRAIDYLFTRSDIDTTRIGMLGLSLGGLVTFELSSIDSRIKSAVAGLTPIFKEKEFQTISPTTFASRINNKSFLMFMGNKDGWYTMKEARQLYDMIPIKNKEFVEYNTGHEVTIEYVALVTDWFVKNLKP